MPCTAPFRPASTRRTLGCSAVAAIVAMGAVLMFAPAGAAAKTYTLRPLRSHSDSLVFRLAGIEPKSIVAARLYRKHRLLRLLNLRRVRAGARRGYLRVRLRRVGDRARALAAHHRPSHRVRVVTDTSPPETSIASGPNDTVSSRDASFAFSSSEPASTFQCRLDGVVWGSCMPPKSYSGLTDGGHRFEVRATDTTGNVDPSPAAHDWRVDGFEPTTPPQTGESIFDADYAHKGLMAYATVWHPERISIVDDPVLGSARKVAKLTVYDGDTGPTSNPRAQMEVSHFWDEGEEFYVGVAYYFPQDFPTIAGTGSSNWVNLGEVYGPPYSGGGPNKILLKRLADGREVICLERNQNYNYDRPFVLPLVRGRWTDLVMRIKLSQDPTVGFWEVWANQGSGYQRLLLHGQDRLYFRTMDSSNNGGANYHKVSHYRAAGMWPVATSYIADHRIGTSFEAVAPGSF